VQNLVFLIHNDEAILKAHPEWTYDVLNNTNVSLKNKLLRLLRSVISKTAALYLKYKLSLIASKLVINKNYYWQLNKAINTKSDLFIAHNLGALAIAHRAAKISRTKYGFDAEDFHRNELTDDELSINYRYTKYLEDHYLIQTNYLTAASPLIAKAYLKLYPDLKPIVINNVCSSNFLQEANGNHQRKELKLFWFSQTIGKGRGIEDAMKAIGLLKRDYISLTLLGNIDEFHRNYFLNLANDLDLVKNQLIFIPPVAPDNIFELANNYDIGLALEQSTPLNRDICLTNKIFTYLTSGLAVIASETIAQKDFIIENPLIGKSYPIGDIQLLSKIINEYDQNRALLLATKLKAQQLAKEKLNWEMESKKFIHLVEETLLKN